jgi:hypothetical protein
VFRWLALGMASGHIINLGSTRTLLALSDLSFFFFLFYAYHHLSSAISGMDLRLDSSSILLVYI